MSTVAKVLVVLNVVLAAAFLGTAANYLGNQDTWRAKNVKDMKAANATIAQRDASISELESTRSSLGGQLTDAQSDRDKAQTENGRLSAHNEQLKGAYSSLAENHGIAQRAMDRMTNTIKANRELITSLQDEVSRQRGMISSIQENRDQLQQILNARDLSLGRSETANKEYEKNLASSAEELRKAQFSLTFFRQRFPGVEAISQPSHNGQVLASDSQNNVYVISLGAEDGVKPGFQYTVSRGDEYVATIQIDNVQSKKSSGTAVRDLSKSDVQVGDSVMSGR